MRLWDSARSNPSRRYVLPSSECYPIDVAPGQSRLFLDYCAADPAVRPFYPSLPRETGWQQQKPQPDQKTEKDDHQAAQNPSQSSAASIAALRAGAATV